MPSPPSSPLPLPSLSPPVERLKASLPSQALPWPCGPLTCTGQCQLCGINLKSGALVQPRKAHRHRPDFATSLSHGYVRLPNAFDRTHMHRAVWELANNRAVPPRHDIHHIDGVKTHNCPHNLQALPHSLHAQTERHIIPLVSFCLHCGKPFRTKNNLTYGPQVFCSNACQNRSRYAHSPPPVSLPLHWFALPTPAATFNPHPPATGRGPRRGKRGGCWLGRSCLWGGWSELRPGCGG